MVKRPRSPETAEELIEEFREDMQRKIADRQLSFDAKLAEFKERTDARVANLQSRIDTLKKDFAESRSQIDILQKYSMYVNPSDI